MWELHDHGQGPRQPGRSGSSPTRSSRATASSCRPFRKRDLDAEVGRFMEVYNAAWEKNWGFVPLTEHEVRHYAKTLQAVPRRELGLRGREGRRDGRRGAHAARLQPGAAAHERPHPPVRLGQGAARTGATSTACACSRSGSSPSGSTPGVAAKFYERHFAAAERTPPEVRRDGLDPGDEQGHEPRHGGDGRRGRAPLPPLRARLVMAAVARRAAPSRCRAPMH